MSPPRFGGHKDKIVREAARILHNFDIPKGLVREGESPQDLRSGYTQWTVIGALRHKRYYYWTEFNRRMRLVDLSKLNFDGSQVVSLPLDEMRAEDVKDRTQDFSA